VKQGWDHPEPNRLRLSLLHTPRIGRRFRYQRRQDFGAQRFRIGLAEWRAGEGLDRLATLGERFRQPLVAFRVPRMRGGETRRYAPVRLDDPGLALMALKPAEASSALVLRLRECRGAERAVRLRVAAPFRLGSALDGAERPVESAGPIAAFGLRAFAIEHEPAGSPAIGARPTATELALDLPRDRFAVRALGDPARGPALDRRGRALPRHLVPRELVAGGVRFDLAPLHLGSAPSALEAGGQRLSLPSGFRRLSLLIGACAGAVRSEARLDGVALRLDLPDSFAAAGRFDERRALSRLLPVDPVVPGWLERRPVRLRVDHLLDRRGRIAPCRPFAIFGVDFAIGPEAAELELPRSPGLLLFAATVSTGELAVARALTPLFADDRDDR
jgi:hypothetical protein